MRQAHEVVVQEGVSRFGELLYFQVAARRTGSWATVSYGMATDIWDNFGSIDYLKYNAATVGPHGEVPAESIGALESSKGFLSQRQHPPAEAPCGSPRRFRGCTRPCWPRR